MTTVKGFLQMLSQNEDFIHHQHYFNLMLDELERLMESSVNSLP